MTDQPVERDGGASEALASEDVAAAAASAALRRLTKGAAPAPKRRRPRTAPADFSDGRDPQPLGAAMDRLVRDQGWQDQTAVAALIGDWASIVGRDLAEHVTAVGYSDGELTLQAESTTWATQVRLLLPQVHRAIDERVGRGVVTRIQIRGPQGPSWIAGPRRVKGRGPRDTYG